MKVVRLGGAALATWLLLGAVLSSTGHRIPFDPFAGALDVLSYSGHDATRPLPPPMHTDRRVRLREETAGPTGAAVETPRERAVPYRSVRASQLRQAAGSSPAAK